MTASCPAARVRTRLHYVDFDGLRTGAAFVDLPLGKFGFSAKRVELPDGREVVNLDDADDYVGAVADRLEESPQVLIGYCGGAYLAYRLMVALAEAGTAPRVVVMIDPEPGDPEARRGQYARLLGQLGAEEDRAATLAQMRASLARAYDGFVSGLPEADRPLFAEEREQTLDRYVGWLAFVGAGSTPPPAIDVPFRVLLSREMVPPPWVDESLVVRVEAGQEDLLASEEAAAVLAKMAREAGRSR